MVRIAVQLVRASDGFSAWSGRFDRRLDDIFTVQDDIAGMIAESLTQRVATVSAPLVTSKTSNTEAYSLYLEGRYLWNKRPGDVVWVTGTPGLAALTLGVSALTAGLRRGGALAGLLMLPLAVPLLIFGAGLVERGNDAGALQLLAAVSLLLVAGAPFAAGAAIRAARD